MGDSITELSSDGLRNALQDGYRVRIAATSGATAPQMVGRVATVASANPDQVIVNLGTNDALRRTGPAAARRAIEQIVGRFPEARCIHLVTVSETITVAGRPRSEEAAAVNRQLRSLADADPRVRLIDWNAAIAAHGGNDAMTRDTVHPSRRGTVVLADAYRDALRSC